MLINFLNVALKGYANKYFVGPILFTLAFAIVLFYPYDSLQNYDLIASFFSQVAVISTLLLIVCIHNILNQNEKFKELFAVSLTSVMMSVMAIIFFKTYSFLSALSIFSAIIAAFAFFAMFKEIINMALLQSKK